MDLLSLPVRLLARPAAAALDVEGGTPEERAANLTADANREPEDQYALAERHLVRSMIWLVAAGVLVPAGIPVDWLIRGVAGGLGLPGTVFLAVYWTVALGTVALMLLHALKAMLSHYVIGSRWNPRSRAWRLAMVDQRPDALLALLAAVGAQLSH